MRQQINLHQPIFTEARKPLSLVLAAVLFGAVIATLAGYSVYRNERLQKLEAELIMLRAEQAEQDALLATAGEQQARREQTDDVDVRIATLERMLAERNVALEALQSGAAGQTTGFANRMAALARRHVDGLWLDKLVLSGTNGSMSLSGATLDANTVPEYLRSLSREDALSGTRFDDFIIERPTLATVDTEQPANAPDGVAKKRGNASPAFIRFRAGSKALSVASPAAEAPT